MQVQEDDFALYLTWALDLIKEERGRCVKVMGQGLYGAER